MVDNMKNNDYCIMDNNGMILEKSEKFNTQISGYLLDIKQKATSILGSNADAVNSVEIFFENSVVLIKDNSGTNINMTMIVDNKEK
jgi:hypothetical protein